MPDGQDSLWSLQICLILVDLMKMDILYRIFDFVTSFLLMASLQGLLELSALSRPLLDSVLFLLLLFVCAFSESKDLLWIESFGPKLSIPVLNRCFSCDWRTLIGKLQQKYSIKLIMLAPKKNPKTPPRSLK